MNYKYTDTVHTYTALQIMMLQTYL